MGFNKLILTTVLLTVSSSAFASSMAYDEGSRAKTFGSGDKSCHATCIATCGKGLESNTLVGAASVIGYGKDATSAFNQAALGCNISIDFGGCGLPQEFSTRPQYALVTGDVVLTHNKNGTGGESKNLVVNWDKAVVTNVENCKTK